VAILYRERAARTEIFLDIDENQRIAEFQSLVDIDHPRSSFKGSRSRRVSARLDF
jgi:hypothetical protein